MVIYIENKKKGSGTMKEKCYNKEIHEKLINLVDWNFYYEISDLVKKALLVFSAGTSIIFILYRGNGKLVEKLLELSGLFLLTILSGMAKKFSATKIDEAKRFIAEVSGKEVAEKLIPERKAYFLCHKMERIWKNEIIELEENRRDEAFFIRMKHLIEKEVRKELNTKQNEENKKWKLFNDKYSSENLHLEKF
jgi:hypothetical protein